MTTNNSRHKKRANRTRQNSKATTEESSLNAQNVSSHKKGVRNKLHSASQRGVLEHVRLLLRGEPIPKVCEEIKEQKGEEGQEVKVEKDEKVEQKDEDKPSFDINEPDGTENGDTCIHLAARYGHVAVARELCEWGARVNGRNAKGDMPLHLASAYGNTAMIRFLLQRRARIEARGHLGRTPLIMAALAGQTAAVRLLLENGADLNAKDEHYGDTALHSAAFAGELVTLKFLLNNGADANARNRNNDTALHRAATSGHVAIVQLLIGRKVEIEARNSYGWTALHSACASGQYAVAKSLISSRALIESRDSRGDTPLHICGWFGKDGVARLLIWKRAQINSQNTKGQTPLHNAAWSGGPDTVGVLLEKGAAIVKDRHGSTPLHLAAANGQVGSFQSLLRAGGGLDSRGEWGRTPLHMVALGSGDCQMARFLLDRKANIEAKDTRNGDTVLHLASEFGKVQLVQALLSRGAKLDSTNRDGDTPLHRAALTNQVKVAAILLERGAALAEVKRRFDGRTALHIAVANHNLEAARTIYKISPSIVTAVDDNFDTCLHLLCSMPDSGEQREFIQTVLIDNSTSDFLNAQNSRGETALHLCCLKSSSLELLELLLEKGASTKLTTNVGKKPVEIAEACVKEEFVTALLVKETSKKT